MSNFTKSTVYTFSNDPTLCEAWQTVTVRDADSNPFLFHRILAISAQQLASQPQEPGAVVFDYERHFRHHQDEAITQYRKILEKFHIQENEEFAAHSEIPWIVGPVFALSVIIVIVAVAGVSDQLVSPTTMHTFEADDENSPTVLTQAGDAPDAGEIAKQQAVLDNIISIFVAIRGTRSLVSAAQAQAQNVFHNTMYRSLIEPYKDYPHSFLTFTSSLLNWYSRLRNECLEDLIDGRSSSSREERQLCAIAIDQLQLVHCEAISRLEDKKKLYESAAGSQTAKFRPDIGCFLKWTAMVSRGFLSLLQRRHPASLVVLAQFTGLCSLAEDQWYLKHLVKNAIAAIQVVLGAGKGGDWVKRIATNWAVES